jgi:hypothetical protein
MEAMMKIETAIPIELLDLKARLDQWRANRKYLREPLPNDLRQAVIGAVSPAVTARIRGQTRSAPSPKRTRSQ